MAQQPTILVVDDVAMNIALLKTILHREGFEVLTATSGIVAREIALSHQPDLILLDIVMPEENGFETCQRLKDDSRTQDIPVIFISALDDVQNKVKGLTIGAVDYISKPFEREEVLARTRIHLKLKEAYQALVTQQSLKLKQLQEAQQALLTHPEDYPKASFAVIYRPFMEAGGDFYDVVPTGDDIYNYVVADIAGHDLKASFITAALKAAIQQNVGALYTPVESMSMLNSVMGTLLKPGQYLTAVLAQLNRRQQRLTLVSGGHPPVLYQAYGQAYGQDYSPAHQRGCQQLPEILETSGDVIGAFPKVRFDVLEKAVRPGDRFFLYTDALIEGFGKQVRARSRSLENLQVICQATGRLPLADAVQAMVSELFTSANPPQDDILLMGIEI